MPLEVVMEPSAFVVKRKAGKQYLIIPRDRGSIGIVSEDGGNYGSWFSWESFVEHGAWRLGPLSVVRLEMHEIRPAL